MVTNQARSRLKKNQPKEFPFKKHLQYGFSLLIAILLYLALYFLMSKVYPSQIQNFIFKNSYLPFFLLLFVADFFFFTFLFLNKNIGLLIAFAINLILYFKTSQIAFSFSSLLVILLLIAVLGALLFFEKIKELIKK